ncbi:tellurite resistance TerB family protein [Parafrankia elaeagni]|uniref:tellurite resistance TerB family protein n=1 Tax=Parafrankia elaeagni TaxID=222534 RepID=UPI001E29286A|nr:tellurite resistance TerB family protein [Parafrankia elaeagni]
MDVALLVELDGGFLVHSTGDGALRFPGGAPRPGESSLAAAGRLLRATLPRGAVSAPGSARRGTTARQGTTARRGTTRSAHPQEAGRGFAFAGCVEHSHSRSDGGATPAGGPTHDRHVLTVLYAVVLDPARHPTGTDLPPGLRLLRPYEGTSGTTLADIRPVEVGRAATAWWSESWPSWNGLAVTDAEPWWTALRQSVRTLRAQLIARRDDLHGEAFRDAAVAVCALVAVADGRVDPEERDAMVGSIHGEAVLADYPRTDLEHLFDQHVARLRADLVAGRRAALREIGKVRGDSVRSWAVLRFGAVVGRADGYFDPDERRVVQDAADVLGLSTGTLAVQAVDEGTDDEGTDDEHGGDAGGGLR